MQALAIVLILLKIAFGEYLEAPWWLITSPAWFPLLAPWLMPYVAPKVGQLLDVLWLPFNLLHSRLGSWITRKDR